MESIYIGLSGKMRSGKTSVADVLSRWGKRKGLPVVRCSIASKMKDLVKKGLGRTDRITLQKFGTDIVTNSCWDAFGKRDFWVSVMLAELPNGMPSMYICDDVRFPWEVARLRSEGWPVVRLLTSEEYQQDREEDPERKTEGLDHTTETALDEFEGKNFFDLETPPDATVDDIAEAVMELLQGASHKPCVAS